METKMDSRQGQFPASFPDTFKNFFEMMNEEEDHLDLISNLLEDKVIPRTNNHIISQRPFGGSLRCDLHPRSNSNASGSSWLGNHVQRTSISTVDGDPALFTGGGLDTNRFFCGRSNSFRLPARPRGSLRRNSDSRGTVMGNICSLNKRGICAGNLVSSVEGGTSSGAGKKSTLQKQAARKSSNPQVQQKPPSMAHRMPKYKKSTPVHDYGSSSSSGSIRAIPGIPTEPAGTKQRLRVNVDGHLASSANSGAIQLNVSTNDVYIQKRRIHLEPHQARVIYDYDLSIDQVVDLSVNSGRKKNRLILQAPSTPGREGDFPVLQTELTLTHRSSHQSSHQPSHQEPHPHVSYHARPNPLLQLNVQQQQQQHLQDLELLSSQPPPLVPLVTHRKLPQPPIAAVQARQSTLDRVQQQSGLMPPNTCEVHSTNIYYSGAAASNTAGNTNATGLGGNNRYSVAPDQGADINMEMATPSGTYTPYGHILDPNVLVEDVYQGPLPELHPDQQLDLSQTMCPVTVNPPMSPYNFNELSLSDSSNITTYVCNTDLNSAANRKSPNPHRRRSSTAATNLLHSEPVYNWTDSSGSVHMDEYGGRYKGRGGTKPVGGLDPGSVSQSTNSRDRITLPKSPVLSKPSGVLTFQQAMSGAMSPQYSVTSPLLKSGTAGAIGAGSTSTSNVGDSSSGQIVGLNASAVLTLEDATTSSADVSDSPTAGASPNSDRMHPLHGLKPTAAAPAAAATVSMAQHGQQQHPKQSQQQQQQQQQQHQQPQPQQHQQKRERGVGESSGSSASIALGNRQRQRMRTSSMPAESRKPRLADTRRAAIHGAETDMDYYRLRSFSITSQGVCNLGDSLRSRRSRSINSVTSTGTGNSGVDRHNSNASRASAETNTEHGEVPHGDIPAYKIAMLGASGVGKTTLTYQFTTSDYICAYDLSLDDDYGQKTVSVLVDGIETDLEIIDHPACEMSTEAFCSTYNIDLFVVVYSVVDRSTFKAAEKVLQYLKENEMLLTHGAILVGNKTDLERQREVSRQMGRKVAKEIACKFIETSSGLDHMVNELLVGVVAQVKLNPQRISNLSEIDRQRLNLQSTIQKHRRMHMPPRRIVRQMSICQHDDGDGGAVGGSDENPKPTGAQPDAKAASLSAPPHASLGSRVRKPYRRILNLESILKMGESEVEDEEELQRLHHYHGQKPLSKFKLLMSSPGTPDGARRASATSLNIDDELPHSSGGSSHRTAMTRLSARTKVILMSVLRFKKTINLKRRNSSSCSDLFVI